MGDLLKPGEPVVLQTSGVTCTVDKFLGAGGQGEVYRATMHGGAPVALKWYLPDAATPEQRRDIERLASMGAPNPSFLWPKEVGLAKGIAGFGYVMPLRPDTFKSIVDLMKRRIDPLFRELIMASYRLADSYLQLHAKGFCYRDISFGNVFFDPDSGEVLICDNDNVSVNGEASGGVLGTPRFMAPEVVRGEKAPSIQTDLFSLSVLLFYMLMVAHPLDGKRETAIRAFDLPAMRKLYGSEALFIFHPTDRSNAPDPTYHRNALVFWDIYPQFLRDLFLEAFVEGIADPNNRVRESVWRLALLRLRDSILYCGKCGAENFYDGDALRNGRSLVCYQSSCRSPISLPYRIKLGASVVMLNYDVKLYPHHVGQNVYDFSKPIAEVVRNPNNPDLWGLKNLSERKWVIATPLGDTKDVEPGRSAPLVPGARIQFGQIEGEIR